MNNINVDVLEIISKDLEYRDLFAINILSKDINNIFKCCEFSSRPITVRDPDILKMYSFKNIVTGNIKVLKYKLKKINLDLSYTKVTDLSNLNYLIFIPRY